MSLLVSVNFSPHFFSYSCMICHLTMSTSCCRSNSNLDAAIVTSALRPTWEWPPENRTPEFIHHRQSLEAYYQNSKRGNSTCWFSQNISYSRQLMLSLPWLTTNLSPCHLCVSFLSCVLFWCNYKLEFAHNIILLNRLLEKKRYITTYSPNYVVFW